MTKCMIPGELVLAVDFDGTITTEPEMDNPLVLQPRCKEVLSRLREDGARLILWTCRSGAALEQAKQFLDEEGMLELFEVINDQLPEIKEKYFPEVARKVGADFYIDDRTLGYTVDWTNIEQYIYGEDR